MNQQKSGQPREEGLLGASFVGPGVAELLHSATIAVPCFPTISEVWLRLLEAHRDTPDAPRPAVADRESAMT